MNERDFCHKCDILVINVIKFIKIDITTHIIEDIDVEYLEIRAFLIKFLISYPIYSSASVPQANIIEVAVLAHFYQ